MDVDPLNAVESAKAETPAASSRWLIPAVAVAVALLATFMGICKLNLPRSKDRGF